MDWRCNDDAPRLNSRSLSVGVPPPGRGLCRATCKRAVILNHRARLIQVTLGYTATSLRQASAKQRPSATPPTNNVYDISRLTSRVAAHRQPPPPVGLPSSPGLGLTEIRSKLMYFGVVSLHMTLVLGRQQAGMWPKPRCRAAP